MALRKIGNIYHAYFEKIEIDENYNQKRKNSSITLGTSDLEEAKIKEAEVMRLNRLANKHTRFMLLTRKLNIEAGLEPPELAITAQKKRIKLSDWQKHFSKYRKISTRTPQIFEKFISQISCKYFDEVTKEIAFDYLQSNFKGKTYNNNKSAINAVFKLLLIDAGLERSPFEMLQNQRLETKHQRPFTDKEVKSILAHANDYWSLAITIAYYTGLRQKDVFALHWSDIIDDTINTVPAKTARFGRGVQIPLHEELKATLSTIKKVNNKIFGCYKIYPKSSKFKMEFGNILIKADIIEKENETLCFNCLRNTFITKCDEAGIPRHAIRGIVGHISDTQTDLYSHDLESAKAIKTLKPL